MPYDKSGQKIPVQEALKLLPKCLFRDIKPRECKAAYYAQGSLYIISTGSIFLLVLGTIDILMSEFFGEREPHPDYIESDDGGEDCEQDITMHYAATAAAATSKTKIVGNCVYCLSPVRGKLLQACTECGGHSCHECIRDLFLLATQDESRMPPRCCGKAIPLAIGRQVLTGTEVETFKEKHEEWNTAERFYCPVSTYSAFLPASMFPELRASVSGEGSVINCPQCDVEIRTACVQVDHAEQECARDNDMAPELVRALEEIGAKRCPKCRAGVEKDDACNSMRCRCGAKWCWHCLRTVDSCDLWPCEIVQRQLDYLKDEAYSSWDDESDGGTLATDDNDDETIPFPEFVDYTD